MSNSLAFQSHLKLAHHYWRQQLQPGDCVIDATCGNGRDTLKLCELTLTPESGTVYAFDIQEQALFSTRILLEGKLSDEQQKRVIYIHGCHSDFKKAIDTLPPIKLIVYNLGYLPGGDKALTTAVQTTLTSINAAIELIAPGGLISITCYPGHPEGALEEEAILELTSKLLRQKWNCCHHRWINKKNAPSLLILQSKLSQYNMDIDDDNGWNLS